MNIDGKSQNAAIKSNHRNKHLFQIKRSVTQSATSAKKPVQVVMYNVVKKKHSTRLCKVV